MCLFIIRLSTDNEDVVSVPGYMNSSDMTTVRELLVSLKLNLNPALLINNEALNCVETLGFTDLEALLKDGLIHTTKNVDAIVLEGTAAKEVAGFLHLWSLLPSDFLMLRWILDANIGESILADFD